MARIYFKTLQLSPHLVVPGALCAGDALGECAPLRGHALSGFPLGSRGRPREGVSAATHAPARAARLTRRHAAEARWAGCTESPSFGGVQVRV